MSIRMKWLSLLLSSFLGIVSVGLHAAGNDKSVTLYTPFTKILVPPGESVNYSIDVINNSDEVKNVGLLLSGVPRGWKYELKSGTLDVRQLSVLPGEKKSLTLKVEVPLKVNKGNYRFNVDAGSLGSLPLTVTVSQQGTYQTEFTVDQPNIVGHSKASFTYSADLKNSTAEKQLYALESNVPRGWNVSFSANGKDVASVDVAENSNQKITIKVVPPVSVEAGTYKIPVRAVSGSTSATIELETVITGTYDMVLTTPTGLLSVGITAGDEKRIELVVDNTGSSELNGIKFSSSAPVDWTVTFDPKEISKLKAGENARIYAAVKASKEAIAGDYVVKMEAKTPEATSKAEFRMSVKTPMIWGWIGVFIVLVALGSVYYLFRKYGRR